MEASDVASGRLSSVLSAAAALAASASESAVRTLLGGSRDAWHSCFQHGAMKPSLGLQEVYGNSNARSPANFPCHEQWRHN